MRKRPLRLLLIEDEPDDAELVCLELERAGFDVDAVRVDSREAFLDALSSDRWDLIISDYAMPHFDGLRAFQLYRESGLDVPFIFVSGALGEERAVEAMRAGARDYLLKHSLARLPVAVKRELDEAENRSQRRIAEETMQREQRRLELAVEASGAGVYEVLLGRAEGAYFSPRLLEILGCGPEELEDQQGIDWLLARVHPEDEPKTRLAWDEFADGRSDPLRIETRLRHPQADWVEVALLSKAVERDASGRAVHVVGVVLDMTERRKLELQLRQAQKMEAVGRLAGGIAHDFNNILTIIFSFGSFVLEALPPSEPAHEDMRDVLSAAKKAAALTQQLLAFSRRQPVEPKPCSINTVVTEVQRMLGRLLGEDIELATECNAEIGKVRVDPQAFEQILLNLAVNARDAMPEGGRLVIATSDEVVAEPIEKPGVTVPPGRYVRVRVADTGSGMSEELQRQIFEPFFTTKEAGKGTGLGLSTCYGLVKQAGGFIWVDSAPGRGTTFIIDLPLLEGAVDVRVGKAARPLQRGTETVLLAEDDEQVRRLSVRTLRSLGYRVIEAADGDQALELARRHGEEIDLLLTDVVMPGMSGKFLYEAAREVCPDLGILYMSGYTADIVADRGIVSPGLRILHKPFTAERLTAALREALDGED